MALQDIFGKMLAYQATVIRSTTSIPFLVNNVTDDDDPTAPMAKGGQVEFVVPPEFATRTVTPASVPPASATPSKAEDTVPCALDHWHEVNFALTGRELNLIEDGNYTAVLRLANAAGSMAEKISETILANYKGIYGFAGTAGTTPFAAAPTVAQTAFVGLTNQKCPRSMRNMLLDPSAYGNAIALDQMSAEKRGDGYSTAIRDFVIPRAYGFDWWEEQMIPTHTTGAATAGSIAIDLVAGYAVGLSALHIDGCSVAPAVGDVFSIAGNSQTYTVVTASALTGTDCDITISPALVAAVADDAVLTFRASHRVNLAFHPWAFGFTSRPEKRTNLLRDRANGLRSTYIDPMTGLALTLEVKDEYHQEGFYLSCLWGTCLVDPRLALRVAG